jgi:hypothetical protein
VRHVSALARRFSAGSAGIGLVGLYTLGCIATYQWMDDSSWVARLTQPQFYLALPAGAALSLPIVLMGLRRQVRDARGRTISDPVRAWALAWRALGAARLRYVGAVTLVSALALNSFIAWKTLIPRLHPYAFDAALTRWDFALHGGAPFRLLAWLPVFLIDPVYYYGWTIGLVAGILTLAWVRDTRALVALLLAWMLLGTLVATLLSSAGPPYFSAVTGLPSPYSPLFERLLSAKAGQPAFALEVQRSLWVVYRSRAVVSGTGISAFPSMHVGTVTLFALASRPRWLRCLAWPYAVLILMSSVALGWHYAVDGYAAMIGVWLIWWLTGRLWPNSAASATGWPAGDAHRAIPAPRVFFETANDAIQETGRCSST